MYSFLKAVLYCIKNKSVKYIRLFYYTGSKCEITYYLQNLIDSSRTFLAHHLFMFNTYIIWEVFYAVLMHLALFSFPRISCSSAGEGLVTLGCPEGMWLARNYFISLRIKSLRKTVAFQCV